MVDKDNVENGVINSWLHGATGKGMLESLFKSKDLPIVSNMERFLYPLSVHRDKNTIYALIKTAHRDFLGIFSKEMMPAGFLGVRKDYGGLKALFCTLIHPNAVILRKNVPFTSPSTLSSERTTFGAGDRLGIASPGHIRLLKQYRVAPVLAQQSVREIELTNRSFEEVLDAATWSVFQEGYRYPWGADGDHLKSEEWVKKVLSIGYSMVTADVSDFIEEKYIEDSDHDIMSAYSKLSEDYRTDIANSYRTGNIDLGQGLKISYSRVELYRVALTYRGAIEHAVRLYNAGREVREEGDFDFELSIDETGLPTRPLAHFYIAQELKKRKIGLSSMAPRFVGEFQKAIDYIGDMPAFERALLIHTAIADAFGYRVSVHSGSDKFLIYPAVGRITDGRFHLKTAGTSWLEALRVLSIKDPKFFREFYEYSKKGVSEARKLYHVQLQMEKVPQINQLQDEELAVVFDENDTRQMLHITYGEVLKNPELKEKLYAILRENILDYWEALEVHIGRHLDGLGVQKRNDLSHHGEDGWTRDF